MFATEKKTTRRLPLFICLLIFPAGLFAAHFEMSQLATELGGASARLADGLRYSAGYGSVRHSAARLASESKQLVHAIAYDRSSSFLRAEFRDISRRYRELERDYLRANRHHHNALAFTEMDRINYLFTSLNNVVYYGQRSAPAYGGYSYAPPVSAFRPRVVHPTASRRHVAPHGNSHRPNARHNQRINRFNYGRRSVGIGNNFDHRSPVLERRQRNRAGGGQFGNSRGGSRDFSRRRN